MKSTSSIFINQRILAVLFLGFSSGLPLALTSSTLQAWFTDAHVNIVTIGMLSLLGLPYIFKFLWAPVLDHYQFRFLGKRRGWILLTQASLALSLFLLAQLNPAYQTGTIGIVALTVAFLSATQDIAVDAYRTDILPAQERGVGASYYVFAYRLAMVFSGGVALVFADYLGWQFTYDLMAVLILLSMISTFKAPRPSEVNVASSNVIQTIMGSWRDLLQQEQILALFFFVIFYKLGDALAQSLLTPFLLNGLGFSLTEVGLAYKFVSFIATILGAFLGGVLLIRWNIYQALLWFGLAQTFSNLFFVVLALSGKHFFLMTSAIFIENFCSGLSTAAFMAFLMSLCNHRYTAGQYALLSAIASIGRVLLGPVAGLIVTTVGWVHLFIAAFLLCFPGLIFLLLLKERVSSYAHVAVD